jgi:tRNA 2-thiouridine synthesizing protein A
VSIENDLPVELLQAAIPDHVDGVLDECGRLCPLPIVHLATWLRGAAPGDVVRLMADDPGFLADLLRWLRVRPVHILAVRRDSTTVTVWLRNQQA